MQKNYNDLLKENGYCLIKNVFNEKTITGLRNFVIKNHSINKDIYLSDDKSIKDLLSKEYFDLLKKVIGENLTYFNDSNVNTDKFQIKTGTFHIDARNDEKDPSSSNYPVYRIGIYLQDHKNFSGGLKIIKKSHKSFLMSSLKNIYYLLVRFKKNKYKLKSFVQSFNYENVPSEAGDIMIWNGRTHHCGRFQRLKIFKNISLHPFFDRNLPQFFFQKEKEERLTIFQNIALNCKDSHNYIHYRLNQIKNKDYWKNTISEYNKFPFLEFEKNSINVFNIKNYSNKINFD